jgi:hypothetical protein
MQTSLRKIALSVVALGVAGQAFADTASKLEKFVGYTIIATKQVDFRVEDGKKEDGFSGCAHGRDIVFTDGTGLTCKSYGYQYAYRPTAVILAKEIGTYGGRKLFDLKMVVGDDVYDMKAL